MPTDSDPNAPRGVHAPTNRRTFLQATTAVAAAAFNPWDRRDLHGADSNSGPPSVARIAITLDLEMSAQYPRRELVEWNYDKGNLDDATKRYALGPRFRSPGSARQVASATDWMTRLA